MGFSQLGIRSGPPGGIAGSCVNVGANHKGENEMSQSEQAPRKIQTEDERRVQRLLLSAINCTQSDDFFSYFDLFAADAVWMMPSSRQDVRLNEAKKFYRFTEKFRFEQQVTIDEVAVFDQRGFARVSFDGYLVPKRDSSAPPLRSVSRHLWLFAKDSLGQWLLTRDIWNNPREQA